jgi:hypothetical protein
MLEDDDTLRATTKEKRAEESHLPLEGNVKRTGALPAKLPLVAMLGQSRTYF